MKPKPFTLTDGDRLLLRDLFCSPELARAAGELTSMGTLALARLVMRLAAADLADYEGAWSTTSDIPRWAVIALLQNTTPADDQADATPSVNKALEKARRQGARDGKALVERVKPRRQTPETRKKIAAAARRQAKARRRVGGRFVKQTRKAPPVAPRETVHDAQTAGE